MTEANEQARDGELDPDDSSRIGQETAKFLDEKALESFKRQIDLEESIWRSLPLLSGGLIAAGAITNSIASTLPKLSESIFTLSIYGCIIFSTASFGAAFWWFWQIIKPRDFVYLPDDGLVVDYAQNLTRFVRELFQDRDMVDKAVVDGLRSYMRDAYIKSAKSTFGHNQERLSARSQVIFFLLCGFVLAFVADGLLTTSRLLYHQQAREAVSNGHQD